MTGKCENLIWNEISQLDNVVLRNDFYTVRASPLQKIIFKSSSSLIFHRQKLPFSPSRIHSLRERFSLRWICVWIWLRSAQNRTRETRNWNRMARYRCVVIHITTSYPKWQPLPIWSEKNPSVPPRHDDDDVGGVENLQEMQHATSRVRLPVVIASRDHGRRSLDFSIAYCRAQTTSLNNLQHDVIAVGPLTLPTLAFVQDFSSIDNSEWRFRSPSGLNNLFLCFLR